MKLNYENSLNLVVFGYNFEGPRPVADLFWGLISPTYPASNRVKLETLAILPPRKFMFEPLILGFYLQPKSKT